MTGSGLRVIVAPPSMRWRNRSQAQGGWHYRHSWKQRDCQHGGYGQGTPRLRRRMSSRPEVTPGVPESSGDRSAGTATYQTPIKRRRCPGSEQMRWGQIKPYGRCASRREIDIPIDAGVGANLWVWHWNWLRIALEGTGAAYEEWTWLSWGRGITLT